MTARCRYTSPGPHATGLGGLRYSHVLITGASGSGTTTLGDALARKLGVAHFDVDDFLWLPTEPPFETRRDPVERDRMFHAAINGLDRWVLSGTLLRWGDGLTPLFDLVVFLRVPQDVRLARLAQRERERYGSKIDPGGSQHLSNQTFMALARGYESGEAPVNNLANAREWLSRLSCRVIEIDGQPSPDESIAIVLAA